MEQQTREDSNPANNSNLNSQRRGFEEEGYFSPDTLVDLVTKYQTRQILCEEVDQLERLGGKTKHAFAKFTLNHNNYSIILKAPKYCLID